MICPNCQKEIPDTAKACGYCGHWLADEKPISQTPDSGPAARRNLPWLWMGLGVVIIVLIGVIAYLFSSGNEQVNTEATIVAAVAATETARAIVILPSETPVDKPQPAATSKLPANTPVPEPTNTSTSEPTNTPKPTHTPVPPTATSTPKPTNTPRPPTPTPVPTATIDADPTVYDNFNNPTFDGTINPGRWEKDMPWGSGCSIQQQEGKVVFSPSNPANSSLCLLSSPSVSSAEAGAVEAMIYAEPNSTGDYNIGIITFVSPLTSDKVWLAQCGIFQDPNNNWIIARLDVHTSNSEEERNNLYDGGDLAFGQWYKFRLELHPASLEVKCYLNDTLIGSHIPEQADIIRANGITRQLEGYWPENTKASYYFDDVRFLPNVP